jgi:hypothetical protein
MYIIQYTYMDIISLCDNETPDPLSLAPGAADIDLNSLFEFGSGEQVRYHIPV